MNKENAHTFLMNYLEKQSAYSCALSIMHFDQCTIAPKDGATYRNKCNAILSGELFSHMTNPEAIKQLEEMAKSDDIDPIDLANVTLLLKNLEELRVLPKDFYVSYENAVADSMNAWEKAKEANDYHLFEPHLKKIITMKKQALDYLKSNQSYYEILLDRFQPGMSMEEYDHFFEVIKEKLLPFIQRIQKEGKTIDDTVFYEYYDSKTQEKVMHELQEYMHYNPNKIYMGVTMHPFTSKICADDTRLSTAYDENNLVSSIFSIIHEYGHALYGMQVDACFDGTPAGNDMSLEMHESQSRLMENCIARRPAFWVNNYPKLQALFPKQLSAVSFDDFMVMLHASRPSFVRTEADELTYPIHVLIRYEIEKMIFNDNIPLDHLDELWADKYEEYLGIRPTHPSEGILQDMHWSDGMFGYFPTYALGSAFASQFFQQMQKEIDVDQALLTNNFPVIMDWLKNKIHKYGASKSAEEIMMDVCQEPFNPDYYIQYLIDTYSHYYGLK